MHQKFTHKEIKKIFPWIKTRTLISWSERGLVVPEFVDAQGRGTKRLFSYDNLLEIAFADELLSRGITFSQIWTMMSEFKWILRQPNVADFLFVADQSIQDIEPSIGFQRIIRAGAVKIKKFDGKIENLFPDKVGRLPRITTSRLIISVAKLKEFIDAQLKEISG